VHSVSAGYFEAMGVELAAGRSFTEFDTPESAGVVVVNETFARRHLTDGRGVGAVIQMTASGIGPLGLNLKFRPGQPPGGLPFEVVGIVKDVRNVPLGQVVEPAMYTSTSQFPFSEVFIAVRAADTGMALAAVREGLRTAAPQVPMAAARTWGDRFAERTAEPRLLMSLLVFFGGLAAFLAALGVYGLFSWAVALRTRELAIRLTLGARPVMVGGLVLRQSAVLVAAGLIAGIGIVKLAETALASVLFGVSATDLASTATASALLVLASLVACVPPALRAMHVDPVEGLRVE
jgi:ABC-type antimicrobial peptide transport system permease subunit